MKAKGTEAVLHSIVLALVVAVCCIVPSQSQTASDGKPLLDVAVSQLQSASSFRLSITQSGAPYPLSLSFDGVAMIPATLERAEAQYISPNELHISAALRILLSLNMDIYSLDDRQWISFPSGAPWFLLPAFEDFNINRLLAANDGIERVVANLQGLEVVATDDEGGETHLRARADSDVVTGLLFGFIEPSAAVEIDFWLSAAGGFARIEILMLETLAESPTDPSRWHIGFRDFDAPRSFEPPATINL